MRFAYLLAPLMAAGCNVSSTGNQGNITFTPSNCGDPTGCDLGDAIALWGTVDVQIARTSGGSITGLALESRDPTVASVESIASIQGLPAWRVTGADAGATGAGATVDLAVIDTAAAEVDAVPITIKAADHLGFAKFVGTATGPAAADGYDESWTVPANQLVGFQARARLGTEDLEGRFLYDVVADPAGLMTHEPQGADHATGYINVQPPAGDYPLTLALHVNPTSQLKVLIHAQ
ncbi:MAG: hypothetical protein K8W52_20095 [Deltaproteobacteria bacterium]|nr:hypothetical protein [Deltaproteobacteria bacterium]